MTKIDDGGPAFPGEVPAVTLGRQTHVPGMTLRDWFAGRSPFSIEAAFAEWNDEISRTSGEWNSRSRKDPAFLAYFARLEYAYADAMIAARKAPTP